MELKLVLPLPTSVNSLYQNQGRYNPRTRSYQLTGRRILTKEGERLKKEMSKIATNAVKESDWDINNVGDRFLYMDVIIYFNRKGRDADNIFKALQDSMQGIVFKNDSQLLPRTQKILFDKNNPRVEISFTPVDYVGVFESKEEALEFEERCYDCRRYLDGRCSILTASLSGEIKPEVSFDEDGAVCQEYQQKKS